jgi:hypothetical protein
MGSDKGGCGGGLILAVLVALVVIVAGALLVGKLAEYNDAEASRLYARGALEESYGRSQGKSRGPMQRQERRSSWRKVKPG